MKTLIYSAFLFCITISGAKAQQVTSHVPWTKEDSAAINALALYPDSVRMEIFTACEYPAIIVDVASLQKNSNAAFADLLSSYPRTTQEDVYNLSRYPNLITQIVNGGQKSKEDMETLLAVYPSEIHDKGLKYGMEQFDLLSKINDLQMQVNRQFQTLISTYPQDVQKVFTDMLQMPEVMALLNDHLSLTVRVGDHYKRDPQYVMHKSDSNALVQAQQNAEQLNAWKQNIQEDTAAQNELKQAANDYADSNGYNNSDVDAPVNSDEVSNYSVYPYSYWFGYPTWYPYSYWYDYPYWYDWGFYYGPGGQIIVFGFPSYYFINWYFWYPYHCHRYPHLGAAYVRHYYGAHRQNTLSRQVVHNWVHENRKYLPADFIKSNANNTRVEAIKQMGLVNEKALDKTGRVDAKIRDQYLAKNATNYPALRTTPAQATMPEEKPMPDVRQQFTPQPAVNPQRTETQRAQPQQAQPNRSQQQNNYNNVQNAQQYHSGSWEQAQPTRQQQQYQAPPQRQQEQRQASPPQQQAPQRSQQSPPQRSNGGGRPK